MLELLIAILIALGINADKNLTAEELQRLYPQDLDKAKEILDSGNYREREGGGVIIVDVIGD